MSASPAKPNQLTQEGLQQWSPFSFMEIQTLRGIPVVFHLGADLEKAGDLYGCAKCPFDLNCDAETSSACSGGYFRSGETKTIEQRIAEVTTAPEIKQVIPSMAQKYPKYYKPVSNLTEVDVYAIHQLFNIQDPSGAIQHASKKLLLSGVRTGGKSQLDDIREARDTLTRWLELQQLTGVTS